MNQPPYRIRFVRDVTVVSVGEDGPGELPPPGDELADVFGRVGLKMVFDLTADEFVDSRTLGQMIRFHQLATRFGKRVRYCCPPELLRVFELTKLDRMMAFHTSLDDALHGF